MPSLAPLRSLTPRLELIAQTLDMARAASTDLARLERLLDASIPSGWPPPISEDAQGYWAIQLAEDASLVGWAGWYFVRRSDRVLVGEGGFKGHPTAEGSVEFGYAILEPFQRHGYATEAVAGLIDFAFADARVHAVTGETLPSIPASMRVMEKNGLRRVATGAPEGTIRFARARTPSDMAEARSRSM